jgi:protein tyrosine/serine phosphatase
MNRDPMIFSRRHALALLVSGLVGHGHFGSDACAAQTPTLRPAHWAQPVALPGVENLYRITDQLYRSQQPTPQGMVQLRQMGIQTIISLRALHSDQDALSGTGLLNEQLHVKTWHIEDEDVVAVLRLLRQPANGPFLIHCQHGADRTGLMSAMYRIVEQGWGKEAAIEEMTQGGYGFHAVWRNIPRYIQAVDVDRIRAQVNAKG